MRDPAEQPETWGTCPACRVELDEIEPTHNGLCSDCSGGATYFPKLALVPALPVTERIAA